jgi:hypothetical protein
MKSATPTLTYCRAGLLVFAILLSGTAGYSQATLTGAIQFSASSSGSASGGLLWNTLGGDSYYNLWLALTPDSAAHLNGPSDQDTGIAIPLAAARSYRFYLGFRRHEQ